MPLSFENVDGSIIELAKKVLYLSTEISNFLEFSSLPEPSFSASSPLTANLSDLPEYEALRAPLNDAAQDLLDLVNGPREMLRNLFFSHYDLAALQVAFDRGFFEHVSLPNGDRSHEDDSLPGSSTADIAANAGMDEDRTARILQLLATRRIFKQVNDGLGIRFEHTASSAMLAQDAGWRATGAMQMDEMFRAASEFSTIIESSPQESDVKNSAFHTRFGMPPYQYYEAHIEKGARFAQAMKGWSQLDRQLAELERDFDWQSLKGGKVVDIGGGSGHISIGLAKKFPSLQFVVQDVSNHMLAEARDLITPDLRDRLEFQQHDFFSPQPVCDADVFLLRQCLHNYNDRDCVQILRAIVPALEACNPGTSLLINDIVLPESGTVTRYEEHSLRQIDLTMLVVFGAKQRSARQFEAVLKEADPRFEIVTIKVNPQGIGLVVVQLKKATSNQK